MAGVKTMVERAEAEIDTLSAADAVKLHADPEVVMVDLRDIRELWRDGRIPGSFHAPRGMLEFWIDRESPYFKDIFASGKRFVFYCNKGWRSALATQTAQSMGLKPVAHVGGGFEAWIQAGGAVEPVPKK
ncbi:MAG: rhodanese-like domain-containing protein [Gammaproteobacteria bacterium]